MRPIRFHAFPREMKKKVWNDFIDHWKSRIDDRDKEKKLHLYAKVKTEFKIDDYLDIPSFRKRQIISKFMCSNHTLRIETGRHEDIPREDRQCQFCNLGKIEDEDHFILECPMYEQIRHDSPINFEEYANTEALFHLEPLNTAEFLRTAYTYRDEARTPDPYHIKESSDGGLKILLRRGNPPCQFRIKNITKDGLRLKIHKPNPNI